MEKTYRSTQKYLIGSPRKIRAVAAIARKMKPVDAVNQLPFASRRAAENLIKVIKSALANARVQGANESELIFKEIQIGEGPRLKRGQAASRGRWHQFKRSMSHIRVVLVSKAPEPKKIENKVEKKEVVKSEKVEPKKKALKSASKKEVKK